MTRNAHLDNVVQVALRLLPESHDVRQRMRTRLAARVAQVAALGIASDTPIRLGGMAECDDSDGHDDGSSQHGNGDDNADNDQVDAAVTGDDDDGSDVGADAAAEPAPKASVFDESEVHC